MDEPTGTGPGEAPTPKENAAVDERKLIEAALEGAEPATGWPQSSSAWFEGSPLPPHGSFPGYDIVREIHRGGQGVVYQAVQLSTRRHVALKVMHSGPFMGSSGRARFEREVQVLGQLDHPNIVAIHDSGVTQDGSCFYVMDYISGKPLDKLMEEGQLPIREALRLFAKICDAVNAAHLKGVIHRDLKPSNIRIDKHGEPIVVDFGLAKVAVPELDADGSGRMMSMTGQFIGSLPWASPEQADGSPTNIDVRTDVYSLGVILYQLLTNRFPYEVLGNMRDVLDNILRVEPARPSTIRRKINDEVETIVLKALAKQRDRRYQSAGDLGRDVHRFLEGQPIEAKRDSGWYVITKTLRRYRGPAALGASALAALVVFTIVITVLYGEAERARDLAEDKSVVAERALEAEAEQRQLAEARLDDAYDLAGTMVTEFYDAIRDLRGATDAKLALAENAVATLNTLEAGAGDDPNRLLLIGRGRLRLGLLYAGRAELHRIGRPEEGESHYQSALAVADRILTRSPESLKALRLKAESLAALSHARRMQKDFSGSIAAIEGAIEATDLALQSTPLPAKTRVDLLFLRADCLLELGNANVEHAMVEIDDAAMETLNSRASASFLEAEQAFEAMINNGSDIDRGELGLARALVRQAEWAIRSVTFTTAEDDTVDHHAMLALLDDASSRLARAIGLYEGLETRRPESAVYPRDRLIAVEDWANALRLRAEQYDALAEREPHLVEAAAEARRRSVAMLEEAVELGRRALNADEANVTLARRLAMLLGRLGQSYEASGRVDEAQATYRESVHNREMLAATDPTNQHFNDAVVGWYRVGAFHEKQAENDEFSARELQAALDAFLKAREFVQKQIDNGVRPDNTHFRTIQDRIETVREHMSAG